QRAAERAVRCWIPALSFVQRSNGAAVAAYTRPLPIPVMRHILIPAALFLAALALPAVAQSVPDGAAASTPLAVGETFTIASEVLGEVRRINVYRPYLWWDTVGVPLPVMYMPDGGTEEDFLHVMGLLQVSVMNGTMRPFLL